MTLNEAAIMILNKFDGWNLEKINDVYVGFTPKDIPCVLYIKNSNKIQPYITKEWWNELLSKNVDAFYWFNGPKYNYFFWLNQTEPSQETDKEYILSVENSLITNKNGILSQPNRGYALQKAKQRQSSQSKLSSEKSWEVR